METQIRDRLRFLVAELGPVRLGFDAASVTEVLPLPRCTRVPWAPPWVEGVVHHQGRVVTVVHLARFLGVPEPEPPTVGVLLDVREYDLALGVGGVRVIDGRHTVRVTELKYFLPEASWVVESLSTTDLDFHHLDVHRVVAGIEASF